jgi:hypothetical protein
LQVQQSAGAAFSPNTMPINWYTLFAKNIGAGRLAKVQATFEPKIWPTTPINLYTLSKMITKTDL